MRELKEAEFWLESAKSLLNSEIHDSEKYTVIIAQSIPMRRGCSWNWFV